MFKINVRSNISIHKQIELRVKELIFKGILKPGMKLPSIRELSLMLNVNANTISKVYGDLQREGIIYAINGKGTFISENYKIEMNQNKLNYVSEELKKLILKYNYDNIEEFIKLVIIVYAKLEENNI